MRKKILFLITSLTGGGAERVVCNLSRVLEKDADIDILINSESDRDYPHGGHVLTLGMDFTKKLTWSVQLKALLKRMSILRKLKKDGGYDACISFMDSANFANILSGRKHCKVIVSERIMLSQCRTKNYIRFVHPAVKLLYPHADVVAAVSKECALDLKRNFGIPKDKLTAVYNGVDLPFIKEMADKKPAVELEEDCFYFLNIGRLLQQKGQWHLIRAFSRVSRSHKNARLMICGSGSDEAYLKKLAKECGVSKEVIFAGFCDNPYAIAARCDAYVSTSLFEGFSNVLIEAMACGLPVISVDFKSSAREILSPDTSFEHKQMKGIERAEYGLITPQNSGIYREGSDPLEESESALVKAMELMIKDDELRKHYREKSLERAKQLSLENIAGEWLELV
ncbi:MAG: glycosyltransferase [Lachnospiraceae bacterium]|nr:glycosyltransferase [Lachnospiraceae bacterium]